ncbi:hypothetical protein AMELA_G00153410 [Ameiurus melas]|uniref:Mucin-19-like n=1 Tax=Ameiurus melas TaxID=219545 RepID=A0A7J6AIG7_AMEME|nr:hypothetical protein AMELA_G00153410 [Ameiurus melas]
MWVCTRLWLLFIALLHLKDVRALGVWSKRIAQDWYGVDGKTSLDQLQETASLPDGAHISTALRDESETSTGVLQTKMDLWTGLFSSEALTNGSFGQYEPVFPGVQAFQKQNGSAPALTLNQQASGMSSSSQNGSRSTFSNWLSLGLSRPYASFQTQQGTNQLISAPALTVNQHAPESVVSSDFTSSPSSSFHGSQSRGSTGYGPSQGLASLYGHGQSSSAPAFVTQQASGSAVSSGSTSSSYSGSQTQGSTVYGPSQGLASLYGQSSSAPTFVTQQASGGAVPSSSTSSSFHGSQTQGSTGYGPSQGLASLYGHGQSSSAPAIVIQQATGGAVPSSSTSSSYSGSQSQGSTVYAPSQGFSRPYVQTQQSTHQPSSAPALTVTQQANEGATTANGSSISSLSAYCGSQSSTAYGLSQGLASLYGQSSSAPSFVNQQASGSAVSSGSTSSTSSSFHGSQTQGSQTQGSTVYGPSQGLASLYGQSSSAPAFVNQQATGGAVPSSSTSSSYSGSQSQGSTVYAPSQVFSRPYGSFQTQQSTHQLSSAPALTVTQQATEGATTANGSSISSLSAYSGSPSSTGYGLSQGIASQYGGGQSSRAPAFVTQQATGGAVPSGCTSSSFHGSQTQGSTVYGPYQGLASLYGQSSSAPAFVIQQASGSAVPSVSTSSSFHGSQTQGSTGYGPSQGLASLYGHGQSSSAPAIVIQQASGGAVPSSSTSSSYSGSQSQGSTVYAPSQGLSRPYVQTQQSTHQPSSAPALTITQQANEGATTANGSSISSLSAYSGSPSSTGYGLSQGTASQYGGVQSSHAPAFMMQPASESAVSSGFTSSTSSSYSGSQSPTAYWLSLRLSSQYAGSQSQQGKSQLGSVPGLTVIQQASASPALTGSTSSTSSSFHGSRIQGSTVYGPSQGLASLYGHGQSSSAFVTQQASGSAVSSGSTSNTSSSFHGSQTQGSTVYGPSQGFSSPYGSFQMQLGTNQQTSEAATAANGSSTSSLSSAYVGSQSSTGSGLSQGLASQQGSFQTQQGIHQLGSAPALTLTQQASGMSSSSHNGSQSPSSHWLSLGLSKPYGSFQTQQGTSQLSSAPALSVTRQATEGATTANGSSTSSFSSSITGSQGPTAYWLVLRLPSQYAGSQAQQGINQLVSVPGLNAIQQASASAVLNGSTSGTSSSYTGSQSQSATAYGSSHSLSNLYDGLHKQHDVQWLSSVPALAVNQQASGSTRTSNSSNTDASNAYSAPQSHSLSYGLVGSAHSIPNQNFQQLGAFNQLVPSLWLGQQSCKKTVQ